MSLRIFRRVSVLPGAWVNLSRHGPSLTVGVRGAHVTVGRYGVRRTVGVPGTGVYYTSRRGLHSGGRVEGDAILIGLIVAAAVATWCVRR